MHFLCSSCTSSALLRYSYHVGCTGMKGSRSPKFWLALATDGPLAALLGGCIQLRVSSKLTLSSHQQNKLLNWVEDKEGLIQNPCNSGPHGIFCHIHSQLSPSLCLKVHNDQNFPYIVIYTRPTTHKDKLFCLNLSPSSHQKFQIYHLSGSTS